MEVALARQASWRHACAGRGNCWARQCGCRVIFRPTQKGNRIQRKILRTMQRTTAEVLEGIEYLYNPTRRYSHLGGVSPEQSAAATKRHCSCVHETLWNFNVMKVKS